MTAIKYRAVDADGLKVFYREAGATQAPALLLLHGFPSASHPFRGLIPLLADRFRLVAPDLPGFLTVRVHVLNDTLEDPFRAMHPSSRPPKLVPVPA